MPQIERQLQGEFLKLFSQRIEEQKIKELSSIVVQEDERADISIKTKDGQLLFFIELKDPTAKDGKTVFNQAVIDRETKRAQKLKIAHFGICNLKNAAAFTVNSTKQDFAQKDNIFTDTEIKDLQSNFVLFAEKPAFKQKMFQLIDFYLNICQQIVKTKTFKGKNMDELFIFVIKELMDTCADPIAAELENIYNTPHSPLIRKINDYCSQQLWDVPQNYQQFKNLTFISLLVLISKLIFYKCYYDSKEWTKLAPLTIDLNVITNAQLLQQTIFDFFNDFKSITGNFETLIGKTDDAIFLIPFVSDEIIPLVQDIINYSNLYDFSQIQADVVGRIFEELISPEERHKLGQYFTPPAVIDLMLSFCLTADNCDAKVFDPSCGSGTFLVRTYARKRHFKPQQHEALLQQIWGNDLSNYPAYLAMFNLAIRQHNRPSYPRIFNKDFFAITDTTRLNLHTEDGHKKFSMPQFDIIVGNPPYTRQEHIGYMEGTQKKSQIVELLAKEQSADGLHKVSQRSSLYAYFFYRSAHFLKENGFMAFVVANSWLESDFGADLQRFFCAQFHIIAIIDSQTERFFPSASVNTTIVILQKKSTPNPNHQVRFIYLKQNLEYLLQKSSKSTNPYIQSDAFCAQLLSHTQSTENEQLKIRLVAQSYLSHTQKWGQFLKAPQVFFDLFHTHAHAFKPLSTFATVKFGIKTGNNEFFIGKNYNLPYEKPKPPAQLPFIRNNIHNLPDYPAIKKAGLILFRTQSDETWLIEKQLLQPVFSSPKNSKTYTVDLNTIEDLVFSAFKYKEDLRQTYPHAYEYILQGEKDKIHEKSTLASRKIWYNLNIGDVPQINFNKLIHDVGRTFLGNILTKDTFFSIFVKEEHKAKNLFLYLNSTLIWLYQQITMRANFGDGVGEIQTYEFADFPVLDIDLSNLSIDLGRTASYKDELGAARTLADINPQRLKLDRAILDALQSHHSPHSPLTPDSADQLLLSLYQATKQLIDKRLEKPASVVEENEKRQKTKETATFASLFVQIHNNLTAQNISLEQPDKSTLIVALKKIIAQFSSNARQREKILSEFWLSHYKEPFNEHQILNWGNQTLF